MSCITEGVTIIGDQNNRLLNSVLHVAKGDNIKATVIAGYINTPEFRQYVKENTDIEEFLEVNANTFRRLLNSYYKAKNISVNNSIDRKMAASIGNFSSATALSTAIDHTANLLLSKYHPESRKSKEERKSNEEIVKDVAKDINKTFFQSIAMPLLNINLTQPNSNEAKRLAEEAKKANDAFIANADETDSLLDELEHTKDEARRKEIEDRLDILDEEFPALRSKRYVTFFNLIQEAGNIQQKNFANLTAKVRGNSTEWFREVFTSSKLVNISKDFDTLLRSYKLNDGSFIDENDAYGEDEDGTDKTTAAWNNKELASFDRYTSADIKIYLESIYRLSTPTEGNYDTNNELGVPMTMGSNYIIAQVSNFAASSSVNEFIESIERKAKAIPSLYGLIKITNDMRNDREFANRLFSQLSHPKIPKLMAILAENGIDFRQSNRAVDPVASMLFDMINQSKFTIKTGYSIEQAQEIQRLITAISKERSNELFANSPIRNSANNYIKQLFTIYFPKINRNEIDGYLSRDKDNLIQNYIGILQNLNSFVQAASQVIDSSNAEQIKFNEAYKNWVNSEQTTPMPVYDDNNVDYKPLNAPLINLAKSLTNYIPVKNELNSTNAEGNLSSDIVDNNYISNFMKQIAYGNEEDSNKGLNNLKEYITKGHQYDYSKFYYGIKDNNGKLLVPGLFIKDEAGNVTINPDARDIIKVALFNGAKDWNNTKAVLYAGMSRADYFLTQLIAYYQPIDYIKTTNGNFDVAGFFMKTPSDSPKNHVAQLPKASYNNLWTNDIESERAYIDQTISMLNNKLKPTNQGEYAERDDEVTILAKPENYITADNMYEILKADNIENRNYNNVYAEYDRKTNKVIIPLIYKTGGFNTVTVWLEGTKALGTITNVAENLKIISVVTNNNQLPKVFTDAIIPSIVNNGIADGSIKRYANPENAIFRGFYQDLYGELNNFIENLNNVFEKKGGVWKLKKDKKHLLDKYHIQGDKFTKDVDGQTQLAGNVFSFNRLFKTGNLDVNSLMKDMLLLYGGTASNQIQSLISSTKSGNLTINLKRDDIIREEDGRLKLNISTENKTILNNIIDQWITAYSQEIYSKSAEYNTVVNDRFDIQQIEEYALNSILANSTFDDIFEGDSKLYKDAQTILKRAKEVLAGGEAYGSQNLADTIAGGLTDIINTEGSVTEITIKGRPIKLPRRGTIGINPDGTLTERNGFRAITIKNTVRGSQNVKAIYDELIKTLTPKVGEKEAQRIAVDISTPYGKGTITNDAQSYITFEEFIARKFADGTLSQYEDLIEQIYDVREKRKTLAEIDLKGIGSRIQVQKNFYYDTTYNPHTQTHYTRQIKNAEFVIIPELLPESSQLHELYNIMRRNDIGQVNTEETSKAAKSNVLTFWDNDGNINSNFEKEINGVGENVTDPGYNDDIVENYYYRFLYKQQEVPEHMRDAVNKAGIQILKKIIDNANTANENVRTNVRNFFNAYTANIKEDFNTLLNNMGWKVVDGNLQNKDGNNTTNLDFTEFYSRARVEAQRLGMDKNFIDYLIPNELGHPNMPNYMNNVSTKLESIAQAIFNSAITRQKLPGWHAAQITSVGFDKRLKYHPAVIDENGNIKHEAYAEILLPRWSNLIPKGYDIAKLAEERLDIHIGYRIPTEGKQSVSVLKIVGFLDESYGSTIVVPDEWVEQTGSDFDVDSVYGISYEMYLDKNDGILKKVPYDLEKDLDKQSRAARNNIILDAMVNIMNDPASREENYSRSNFEDLSDAMDKMDDLRGAGKVPRSSYNPFDQIDFMNNAMSGATLKAFSVSRDTFNSVNNYIQSKLSEDHIIPIEYDLSEYDINALVAAYGEDVIPSKDGKTAIIRHKRMAWSNNNRNVLGKLITPYSSQTTAHILDAIKTGSIYNENKYTFGTFKTLIDLGTDYETAIAFLMQPGITEIVNANNEIDSVYINNSGNPIRNAIKSIANRLGLTIAGQPIDIYSNYNEVVNIINDDTRLQNAFKKLFLAEINNNNSFINQVFNLNKTTLQKRLSNAKILNNSELSETDKVIIDAAYDLAMISTFNKIHNTTANIESLMRCSNPDKFGAKQTIRSTRKTLENIIEYSDRESEIGTTLIAQNKPFCECLYPGLSKGNLDVKQSGYPYLAAFLKYATMPSVQANSKLFATESEEYNKVVDAVERRLGITFTDEQYKEYKKYMATDVYNSVPFLSNPLIVNDYGYIDIDQELVRKQTENGLFYWNIERARLFGYDKTQTSNLEIKDVNSPTGEEIRAFNELTPAQKVIWVQQHFPDGAGIFGVLNVNAFNQFEFKNKGFSSSTIKYGDQIDNPNQMILAFSQSFFNKNPLVRLTAVDLIKYAFVVEGFNFKKGAISKIVPNMAMLAGIEDKGLNLIQAIDEMFNSYVNPNEGRTRNFIEKFVRSHSDIIPEVKIPKAGKTNQGNANIGTKFSLYMQQENMLYIPYNDNTKDIIKYIGIDGKAPKDYIRLKKYNNSTKQWVSTLYRIDRTDNGVYFLPLNLLERNEVSDYSVNKRNNRFKAIEYYEAISAAAAEERKSINDFIKNSSEASMLLNLQEEFTIKPRKSERLIEAVHNANELIRLSQQGTAFQRAEINKFLSDVADYISSPVEGVIASTLIHNDSVILKQTIPIGAEVVQNIPIDNANTLVRIKNVKPSTNFKNVLKGNQKGDWSEVTPEEQAALQHAINAKSINPTLYEVTPLSKKEIQEKNYAITSIIDTNIDGAFEANAIDDVAKAVVNEITSKAFKEEDNEAAQRFRKILSLKGVDVNNYNSIHDNKRNIYTAASTYFGIRSRELLNDIEHLRMSTDEEFAIDDPKLYEYLRNHPDEVDRVNRVILEAKTFGQQFYTIFNLNIKGEDTETTKAIENIKKYINDVRLSNKVAKATELMFDNYIANEYATNPNIRNGLLELRTQFGDTDWMDLQLSDIGELNNPQVQATIKAVYSIINEAKLRASRAGVDWIKKFDAIKARGDINMDKVIDKYGRIVRPYNDEFLADKRKYNEKVYETENEYGINSVKHLEAKLERDKWRAKNLQQEVVPAYYDEINKQVEHMLKVAPKEYSQYLIISNELYGDNRPASLLSEEEKTRKKELKYQLNDLLSEISNGNLKSDEERYKIIQLRNFIKAKKKINSEYFNVNEAEGFRVRLDGYLNYIQKYKDSNPYGTLDEWLLNDKFREAYEWVQANSIYRLNPKANEQLNEAFKILSDRDNLNSSEIKKFLKDANVYDAYGNVDPRKLNEQQIQNLRRLSLSKYANDYDSNAGESILIKDIPKGLPVFKGKFYRALRGEGETAQNPRRLEIIHEINELLSRGVDNSGRIRTKQLFENLSEEELTKLGDLYTELHKIKSNRTKEQREQFKEAVEFKIESDRFTEELVDAQRDLNKTQFAIWSKIFVQTDGKGKIQVDENGAFIPNNDIYGYILPKDKSMIDEAKTKARNLIENSIEYVPTDYYYAARHKALKDGTFEKWYKDNHVFNPFTRKYEPLKVWTKMEVVPGGELDGTYEYIPTNDNVERVVKDEFRNPNFKPYTTNYNVETGKYNNHVNLTQTERDMADFLQSTINQFATTHSMKKFADQGYIPRRAKYRADNRWYASQLLGMAGLEFRNTGETQYHDQVDYLHDFDADFDMMALIKGKGYKEPKKILPRGTTETEEEYEKRVAEQKEENKKIEEENLKIDNDLLDRDYRSVFADFVEQATIYNARQKAKSSLYLLLEDLKDNKAYAVSRYTGNLKEDKKFSTADRIVYQKTDQANTYQIVENFIRRIIYKEFKKDNKYNKYADLLQNMTSAKYMIFNVTGGIANITTGLSNIYGEVFAKEYFDGSDWRQAQAQYFSNMLGMMSDMYNKTSNNLTVAITKLFNVVDFDAFMERRPNEGATEYVKRVRDGLYALQSGGEHYMQNAVLLACLKSHRLFTDFDGTVRAGSFANYTWKTEYVTMQKLIANDDNLRLKYKGFIAGIKNDLNELRKYGSFAKDFNEEFLRDVGDRKLMDAYIKARKEALKNAKEEFKRLQTVESQFELIDGIAVIKENSQLTGNMFAELQQKVISINKKIHGVYDKEGAARIEREWWGGLVMQYHKHLYPGIMKRWRIKGYYNEIRSSIEKGSYITLANYLGTEFKDFKTQVKEQMAADNSSKALASIKVTLKAAIDTIINLKLNYGLIPEWERRNMRRSLGDLLGVGAAFLMAIAIHMMTDDDELKESDSLSTMLYLADRLNAESAMYTPWGLYAEGSTLWSSPIAANNAPEDLLKAISIGVNYLFDEDYDMNYTTGLYRGENRLWVLLRRNIPAYRVYDRLNHMSKNNQYYRINDKALNIKAAKNIADEINPD